MAAIIRVGVFSGRPAPSDTSLRGGPLLIVQPYLLVLNLPLHRHDGGYWADRLWHKDLERHRAGIVDLTIACPVIDGRPPADFLRLSNIAVRPLPAMEWTAAFRLPVIALRLWRAIGRAGVIHTGIVGWPFPLGWLAIPIARLRRRPVVLMIESATWRPTPGIPVSRWARWRAAVCERINILAVARSQICFFTTRAYADQLGGGPSANILSTIWADEDELIDPDRLTALAPERRGRLLFAGRLTAAKGVGVLLDAIERSGVAIDVVGDGELAEPVRSAERRLPHLVRLLEPVGYGSDFMALLDRYAALVMPTLSDDQPRVIFDAFARGLAVLASDTAANREVVEAGVTGMLFAAGDAGALADVLTSASAEPEHLAAMGATARRQMEGRTHAAMHATRARLIAEALGDR